MWGQCCVGVTQEVVFCVSVGGDAHVCVIVCFVLNERHMFQLGCVQEKCGGVPSCVNVTEGDIVFFLTGGRGGGAFFMLRLYCYVRNGGHAFSIGLCVQKQCGGVQSCVSVTEVRWSFSVNCVFWADVVSFVVFGVGGLVL